MPRRPPPLPWPLALCAALACCGPSASAPPPSPPPGTLLAGRAAFGDWTSDAPGVRRRITPADLPEPYATASAARPADVVPPPAGATLHVPAGFRVARFAEGLTNPRTLRVAPNGDVFVAETAAGRVRVLRVSAGAAAPAAVETFASGLDGPFGVAFHPPGGAPRWVYVAERDRVVRFPYADGDLRARGPAEVVVPKLSPTSDGHTTRDLAFTPDGELLLVSVGSRSNAGEGLPARDAAARAAWDAAQGLGAAWGEEERRAAVLAFPPAGGPGRVFAAGLRNCSALAVHPATGEPWCAVNERDGLGDDLVPDFVTRVRDGASYGWPWFYLGPREDPRQAGARPELAPRVTAPDVLLQAHSAPLGLAFYDPPAGAPGAFPAEWRGDALVALHGSWNRGSRTGYKVVRVRAPGGVPAGEYEDFLTGFVVDADRVWGRPVAVAVLRDGAVLVAEDGNDTLWRVSYDASR